MAYTNFDTDIFSNAFANTACNAIIDALQNEFGVSETNAAFALSGIVAKYLQNPTDNTSVRNISFVTNDTQIYAYLEANVSSIANPLNVIAYADRLQIRLVANVFIEVWSVTGTLATVTNNGIVLQTSATIPAALLTYVASGTSVGTPLVLEHGFDQVFNPGVSALYRQEWAFSMALVGASWVQGTATPSAIDVVTTIKNYATDSRYDVYSDYNVEILLLRGREVRNLFFAATINNATDYDLDGNPLSVVTNVTFTNLALFSEGKYTGTIRYRVTAIDSRTSTRVFVEGIDLPMVLKVLPAGTVSAVPTGLQFTHIRGAALPATQDISVNIPGEYTLRASQMFTINADGLTDQSTPTLRIKRATGPKVFTIGITSAVENLANGQSNNAISIVHDSGQLSVAVGVFIAGDSEIKVTPSSFAFEAIIGVRDAVAQAIRVNSILPYTYTWPSWLTINGDVGNSFSGNVLPAAADNFAPGIYTGDIVLTSDEGEVSVPVTYTVKANGFTELLSDKINFTKDQLFVNVATKNTGNYLRVVYSLTWYSFKDVETTSEYVQHIPIFNGLGTFHPGEFVHNIMESLTDIAQFIPEDLESRVGIPFDYYTPAELDISMEQRSYGDDALLETAQLNNIQFVKGTMPNQFADDCGVMGSDYPIRVTPNSYGIINFIKRSGVHNIEVYKNGAKQRDIVHDTVSDSLFGMLFSFADYAPGDLVYLKITAADNQSLYERRFYVFPENKESYHIAWVTEHEQLELLEFTGGYAIDSEYQRIENSVYQNLVNVTEILETNKKQPLTANTGWVLKDNHVLLDSLMRSKKAWLFLPNTDYKIALVPQSKKMSNFDTETGQYAYDVEFKINPDNDAKVYPR